MTTTRQPFKPSGFTSGATVFPASRQRGTVTVIDIACPSCGSTGSVRKVRIGTYRCTSCGHEFDHTDVDPLGQSSE